MRPIDADKAKEVLTELLYETAFNNSGGASLMCEDIAENRLETWFGLVPTVEAETVVRCKDCKHNYHNMIPSGEVDHECAKCIELPITADFYCAWGEREEEVEDE